MNINTATTEYNDRESIVERLREVPRANLIMTMAISASEAEKHRSSMAKDVFHDWNQLNAILERHESTFFRRWTKKTKNRKVEILLKAWPNMPASHGSDLKALHKESREERVAGTKFKDSYMWPYINLEDLSKPETLPLFLQARARNWPDIFATSDVNAARLGYVTSAIRPLFLDQHTMMFTDRQTPQSYGELIAWSDDQRAAGWLYTGRGTTPGTGLVVLEMQQRIMRFLTDCCKFILHDIKEDELTSDKFSVQQPLDLTAEASERFGSLAVMAAEAPYRAPASMDLERLQSLLTARQHAMEDHIFSLREDPAYFSDTLLEIMEHCNERLIDTDGKSHPVLKPRYRETLWDRIILGHLFFTYNALDMYDQLVQQVRRLRQLHAKYSASMQRDKDLPTEYLEAVLKFQFHLQYTSACAKHLLQNSAPGSPNLRPYFARKPPLATTLHPRDIVSYVTIKPIESLKLGGPQKEFLWMLRVLFEDGNDLAQIGQTTLMDELGRLLESEPTVKGMTSSYVATLIGDLAIVTEGLRQVDRFQPWAQTFGKGFEDKKEVIRTAHDERPKYWDPLMSINTVSGEELRLGIPENGQFSYPAGKKRTKENVEKMRAAESRLDKFWETVDGALQEGTGSRLEETSYGRLLSQSRTLQRTEEWVESPSPSHEVRVTPNPASSSSIEAPLSKLGLGGPGPYLEGTTGRNILKEVTGTSSKSKTKNTPANPLNPEIETPAEPTTLTDVQPTFHVDARALKVFHTLFFTPSPSATPGEVHWKDFLHAMVSVGFSPEKLYGSVWSFRPTMLAAGRSIQFHEPHPSVKLAYLVARRIGRRLERAYGWDAEAFQLKD